MTIPEDASFNGTQNVKNFVRSAPGIMAQRLFSCGTALEQTYWFGI